MADVANVISDVPTDAAEANASPGAEPTQQRVWTMPKTPVQRKHVDEAGRVALKAAGSIASVLADVARFGVRIATTSWQAIAAIPGTVRLFAAAVILLLLGLAGSLAFDNALGLICTVVVVPVSALTLGALGQRWYAGQGDRPAAAPAPTDLQRSVEYVDKKLAVALNTFGTERHQQAVIALFQAKTAVELTLGTEQESAIDVDISGDEQSMRPRIRVGSAAKSLLRESPTMAAS